MRFQVMTVVFQNLSVVSFSDGRGEAMDVDWGQLVAS